MIKFGHNYWSYNDPRKKTLTFISIKSYLFLLHWYTWILEEHINDAVRAIFIDQFLPICVFKNCPRYRSFPSYLILFRNNVKTDKSGIVTHPYTNEIMKATTTNRRKRASTEGRKEKEKYKTQWRYKLAKNLSRLLPESFM